MIKVQKNNSYYLWNFTTSKQTTMYGEVRFNSKEGVEITRAYAIDETTIKKITKVILKSSIWQR